MAYNLSLLYSGNFGGMSFQNSNGWTLTGTPQSIWNTTSAGLNNQSPSYVHSSQDGLAITVENGNSLSYNTICWGKQNRFIFDQSSFGIETHFWGRVSTSARSGDVTLQIGPEPNSAQAIGYDTNLIYYNIPSYTTPALSHTVTVKFTLTADPTVDYSFYADDLLVSVNKINLVPGWEYEYIQDPRYSDTPTLGGKFSRDNNLYKKATTEHHRIPITNLNDRDAAMINHWWDMNYDLLFTDDDSNVNNLRIVKLTNQSAPFSRRSTIYNDEYSGTLELSVAHTRLSY